MEPPSDESLSMYRPKTSNTRNEEEMVERSKREISQTDDPLLKLRLCCLARGTTGIIGFGRLFRRMDDDGNKKLTLDEFKKGVEESGLEDLSQEDLESIFNAVDTDGSGSMDFNELLKSIRPPMNAGRLKLVEAAFQKLDSSGNGVVEIDDLKTAYNVKNNPKYLSGEQTEDQILTKFLGNFEKHSSTDGKVTYDEFLDYYAGVSASVDHDGYFDLMMRNAWKI